MTRELDSDTDETPPGAPPALVSLAVAIALLPLLAVGLLLAAIFSDGRRRLAGRGR